MENKFKEQCDELCSAIIGICADYAQDNKNIMVTFGGCILATSVILNAAIIATEPGGEREAVINSLNTFVKAFNEDFERFKKESEKENE